MVPATSVTLPSVLVIDRSAFGFTVVVSVAELSPGLGSLAPTGAATVAVLVIIPVAEPTTVAVTENVTVPPTATLIDSSSEPVPLAAHDPFDAAQVHDTPVSDAGTASVSVAPTASDGPALEAVTV